VAPGLQPGGFRTPEGMRDIRWPHRVAVVKRCGAGLQPGVVRTPEGVRDIRWQAS